MDKIIVFIDNMFLSLPKTEEMAKLKSRLIENLTDKYEDLIKSGLSEDEAFGRIVSEFGSIEEIKKEYGIVDSESNYSGSESESSNKENKKRRENFKENYINASDEFKNYQRELDEYKPKFGILIAVGVALCIIGVVIMNYIESRNLSETLSLAGLFIPVAIGVAIFITSGLKFSFLEEKVKKLGEIEGIFESRGGENSKINYINASGEFKESLKNLDEYKPKFGILIATGVALCMAGVVATNYMESKNLGETAEMIALFIPVAIGVAIFITSGLRLGFLEEKVEKLAEIEGIFEYSKGNKDIEEKESPFTGIIFMLATAIFLGVGFFFGSWYIAPVIYILAFAIDQMVKIIVLKENR
ncbi:hypothetical protein SAMN02745245_01258 [Anaerosphaera aminiphila DSM 21120]|uniref:Uncharacterized protein n=1 Tax=Anaerosphaera aminiphila DSM 21120 TaxID=1120995 RepID=A0A1M5SQT3_9FIRM|nr:permease prefix domain 1-containing protein [Anaerosphaera aminiphila]SHH40934.1 hypothetical protein SAMN02745245_01258 [Anaerosphaera aminiphila DSM 21120]